MIEFESAGFALPETLGAPRTALAEPLPSIGKGGRAEIVFRGTPPAALSVPPRWTAVRAADRDGRAVYVVSAPERTEAREARIFAALADGAGELALPLAVLDALAIRMAPSPFRDGVAGIGFEVRNHGASAQTLRWRLAVPEAFAMANGSFKLNQPDPFAPDFATEPAGELTIEPGGLAAASAMVRNLDPLALYRAVLEIAVDGRAITRERRFGGCVGVPKVSRPVAFDGRLGDPAWRDAPEVRLDQPSQYAVLTRSTARRDNPEDLSGAMKLLWDDDFLYIGMAVQDDVFCNPECDAAIWRGDGLQFLVDPCRDSEDKPGKYDYCLGLGTKGPQAWCGCTADAARAPTEEVSDFRMKITPTGHRGDVVYEIAVPWNRLSPFAPAPGANLGLALIVNDDDGRIRDSFIAWFGCAHSKQMSMNGDLILLG